MRPRRFLAIHDAGPEADLRARLERLAQLAHARGVHPIETMFGGGRAYTLLDAADAAAARSALEAADLRVDSIAEGGRIATELLDEPMRAR